MTINPYATEEYVKADMGFYIQDSWKFKRLTINPGIRYEVLQLDDQGAVAPGRTVRAGADLPRDERDPIWKDFAPRLGVAYDLFGDGRTALKFGANKYMRPMAGSFVKRYNPARGLATDTRDWFDVDLVPGTSTRSGIAQADRS